MIAISYDQAIAIHKLIIDVSGGSYDVRDGNLLDSAINCPFQTFGGTPLYPSIEEKAAKLGYSLISNHAFVDGNKRVGILCALVFLQLNGIRLRLTDDDVINVALNTADGKMDYNDLLLWIKEKSKI